MKNIRMGTQMIWVLKNKNLVSFQRKYHHEKILKNLYFGNVIFYFLTQILSFRFAYYWYFKEQIFPIENLCYVGESSL